MENDVKHAEADHGAAGHEGLAPLPAPPAPQGKATGTLWNVLLFVGLALAGAAIGYSIAALLGGGEATGTAETIAQPSPEWAFGWKDALYLVPGIAVLLMGVLAVHEAGHLVGGWLAGFRFMLFIVGPLRVQRTGRGIEVGWNRQAALAGGLAASTPSDPHADDLDRRTALLVAGGPVMSVMVAAGALALYYALGADDWTSANAAKHAVLAARALFFFGIASAGIAVVTLIPARTSGFYTDGARLWRLWRGGPSAARDEAVIKLGQAMMGAERPHNWPLDWIEAARSEPDGSLFDALGHQMAYYHALDAGTTDEAVACLRHALGTYGGLPATVQHSLALEAAFVEGALRADGPAARAWYERAEAGPFIEPSTVLRAEAAVLAAEGHAEAASACAEEASAASEDSLYPGYALAERDWLHIIDGPARKAADPGAADPATARPASSNEVREG